MKLRHAPQSRTSFQRHLNLVFELNMTNPGREKTKKGQRNISAEKIFLSSRNSLSVLSKSADKKNFKCGFLFCLALRYCQMIIIFSKTKMETVIQNRALTLLRHYSGN